MISNGIALVTGAARGIGKAIALRLADDGFDVAVNDVPANAENLSKVVDEIKAKGRRSSLHLADVSVEGEVKAMVDEVVRVYKRLDVMVANAGVCKWAKLSDTSADEWDRLMAINARGIFLCYKYAGMQMVSQGRGGRIIGACSVAGKRAGTAFLGAYSASKFAIRGLTQAAALEFGPYNITVNAYAPGAIDTDMLDYLDTSYTTTSTGNAPGSYIQKVQGMAPLHKIGTTTDIANLVSFVASKESQFITARGIGKAIALRLADDGFDVAVNDVPANAENLSKVVEEIKAKGRQSSPHLADVSVEGEVKAMVDEVVRVYEGLDVMVANAGVCKWAKLADTSADEWDRLMAINARGTFLCYKYAGMQMVSQGRGGRIIGACSVAGKRAGSAFLGAYCASKFAIRGLTQAAALEFGPHNITVNAYAPGAIDTDMRKIEGLALLDYLNTSSAMTAGTTGGTYLERAHLTAPVRKIGTTTDIANLVSFVASKESQFITGQSLSVNGGMYFD
ncbi:hypothetical protein B0H17DRAFT_1196316 [Mycena rosella]|uniref:NAD(P)-binding protein n=1 Tax=Mycena rosella TaxID=1033263 RepID=A0AAD7DVX1_MYCRO|nr:hypothetical protein B0H17DRAFT_1196316 [Mycena rosella]